MSFSTLLNKCFIHTVLILSMLFSLPGFAASDDYLSIPSVSTFEEALPETETEKKENSDIHKTKIAFLLPNENSSFCRLSTIVLKGVIEANENFEETTSVIGITAQEDTTIEQQLILATEAGASIAIAALDKDSSTQLANLDALPLPVIALNTPDVLPNKIPDGLLFLSISQANEYDFLLSQIKTLLVTEPDVEEIPLAIVGDDTTWNHKIRLSIDNILTKKEMSAHELIYTPESSATFQQDIAPYLSQENSDSLQKRYDEIATLAETEINDEDFLKKKKLLEKAIEDDRKKLLWNTIPPYPVVLLSTSAENSALINSFIPNNTLVFASSNSFMGLPSDSARNLALAYDLDGVIFAESPLFFSKSTNLPLPTNLTEKRLFSLGFDALLISLQWKSWTHNFQIDGLSGHWKIDIENSPVAKRTLDFGIFKNGELQKIQFSNIKKPEAPLPRVVEETENLDGSNEKNNNVELETEASQKNQMTTLVSDQN